MLSDGGEQEEQGAGEAEDGGEGHTREQGRAETEGIFTRSDGQVHDSDVLFFDRASPRVDDSLDRLETNVCFASETHAIQFQVSVGHVNHRA